MKHSFMIALGLAISGLAGQAAFAATSYTNTIAQVAAYITNQMAVNNIQGVSIALVDDQNVVWTSGFGFADREGGVAADADTVYHIGSVSKAFASTAVMQLMDDGVINIEMPLTNYMAEFSMLPRFTNSGPVTIRSLLNHHSGLPGDFFNNMWTTPLLDNYMEWLISYLQGDYPFAPVDERYEYCNVGWMLISDVVRRLDGRSFAAATDARIFTPLGMAASSFIPDKPAISSRLAACYNGNGDRQPMEYLNCLGSGSMYSSANDMAQYIRMMLADGKYGGQTILSTNALTVMTTPQWTNLPLNITDIPQGLGWDCADEPRFRYAGQVFWKDGATAFYCSFLGISRDLKLGVAVIQNSPGSQCDSIGMNALQWAILDKTGQHWPTNTFVPTPSPVTSLPQTNLDALAGLYVAGDGYNKVVSAPGSLTFIGNANSDTPNISTNVVPRANGWFSKADSQDNQVAFTNLGGHDMLVLHAVAGPRESVSDLGERYVPGPLPASWSARTNHTYRQVDMHPTDYQWGQPNSRRLRLSVKDDALLATWASGTFVMDPQSDILALQPGVHYRSGGAIRVFTINGYEMLQHSSYRFLDEAAIPTLPVPSVTNGAIPFVNGTQWYWFAGQTGQTYRARLTAPNQNYFVRITDREGIACGAGTNGPASWACTSNGTYAVAISATNSFAFSLSLTRQTKNDYDGDGRADVAIYRASDGLWSVALSGYGYQRGLVVETGCAGWAPVPGDYDGDGITDVALYERSSGQWLVRLSSSGLLGDCRLGGPEFTAAQCDFDGDALTDLLVYREADGCWLGAASSRQYAPGVASLGATGCQPVAADYDGDRRADPAVYNRATGFWEISLSGRGYQPLVTGTFGGSGFLPASADYDGDGLADPAIYSPGTAHWQVLFSGSLATQGCYTWGDAALVTIGGIPVPADYDGDGKADLAVYHQDSSLWEFYRSTQGYQLIWGLFGGPEYQPVTE